MNKLKKVLKILEDQNLDVLVFKEKGEYAKDNVVYDDGCVHVTRGGYRYAITTIETSNENRIAKLEARFSKIVDKAIAEANEKA